MKTEGAVRHKLKQVRFRYLKRRLEQSLVRSSENCVHNGALDGADGVRVCFVQMDLASKQGFVCDSRFQGCARAPTCPKFALRQDKSEVKAEFYGELEQMNFPEIAFNYPDMAALLWVLSNDGLEADPLDPTEFDLDRPPEPAPVVVKETAPATVEVLVEEVIGEVLEGEVTKEALPERYDSSSKTWVDRILARFQ